MVNILKLLLIKFNILSSKANSTKNVALVVFFRIKGTTLCRYRQLQDSRPAFCGTQRIMLRFRADALRSKQTP